MISAPPSFIFSSDNFLDVDMIRTCLGLNYEQIEKFEEDFHLYRFVGRVGRGQSNVLCRPYLTELILNARMNRSY